MGTYYPQLSLLAGRQEPTQFQILPTKIEDNTVIKAYTWNLQKNGASEETIKTRGRKLRQLSRLCNLSEPEEVKAVIATQKWNNNTKTSYAVLYNHFLPIINKTWKMPKFKKEERIPFIPTEAEIDHLITGTNSKRLATFLQTGKEAGARCGELTKLQWIDINIEQKAISITPEKGSNQRVLSISDKLINMLNAIPKTSDLVFATTTKNITNCLESYRKLFLKRNPNPRIQKITFHTLRHWKGTMEYHKTKDILHVKKNIRAQNHRLNNDLYQHRASTIFSKYRRMDNQSQPHNRRRNKTN
jgi:integrase